MDYRVVEKCVKKEREAQNALYQAIAPQMFSLCIRYMGSREQARDVLQDGFVILFERIGEFRNEGSFEGWARRIFSNSCIDALRRRKKISIDDISCTELESLNPGVCSALAALESGEIMAVIAQLPPVQRSVLNLFSVEGYTHREIAQIMNITEENSRIILLRAKSALGRMLAKEGYL